MLVSDFQLPSHSQRAALLSFSLSLSLSHSLSMSHATSFRLSAVISHTIIFSVALSCSRSYHSCLSSSSLCSLGPSMFHFVVSQPYGTPTNKNDLLKMWKT